MHINDVIRISNLNEVATDFPQFSARVVFHAILWDGKEVKVAHNAANGRIAVLPADLWEMGSKLFAVYYEACTSGTQVVLPDTSTFGVAFTKNSEAGSIVKVGQVEITGKDNE